MCFGGLQVPSLYNRPCYAELNDSGGKKNRSALLRTDTAVWLRIWMIKSMFTEMDRVCNKTHETSMRNNTLPPNQK